MEEIPLENQGTQQHENQHDVQGQQMSEHVSSSTTADSPKSKTNSLKRLFKMSGKKTHSDCAIQMQRRDTAIDNSYSDEGAGGIGAAVGSKVTHGGTMKRIFNMRLRGANKSSVDTSVRTDEPAAGPSSLPPIQPKSTLKASISSYWHNLFKRHQASSTAAAGKDQTEADAEANAAADAIAKAVSSGGADSNDDEDGTMDPLNMTDEIAKNKLRMANMVDEVQMLALSEDVEEDQKDQSSFSNKQQQK